MRDSWLVVRWTDGRPRCGRGAKRASVIALTDQRRHGLAAAGPCEARPGGCNRCCGTSPRGAHCRVRRPACCGRCCARRLCRPEFNEMRGSSRSRIAPSATSSRWCIGAGRARACASNAQLCAMGVVAAACGGAEIRSHKPWLVRMSGRRTHASQVPTTQNNEHAPPQPAGQQGGPAGYFLPVVIYLRCKATAGRAGRCAQMQATLNAPVHA